MNAKKIFNRSHLLKPSNKLSRRFLNEDAEISAEYRIVQEVLTSLDKKFVKKNIDLKRKFDETNHYPLNKETKHLFKLTRDEENELEQELNKYNDNDMQFRRNNTEMVSKKSMNTLKPGMELNDEIINMFFSLLQTKTDESNKPNERCLFLSTYFIPTLRNSDIDGYNFDRVKNWKIRHRNVDLFQMDKIFIPCHINNNHWTCAVIFIQRLTIYYLDPLPTYTTHGIPRLLIKYLKDEWSTQRRTNCFNEFEWNVMQPRGDEVPTQRNNYDCGVYVCMYAYYMSCNKKFDFHSSESNIIRQRLAYSIMKQKIYIHINNDI